MGRAKKRSGERPALGEARGGLRLSRETYMPRRGLQPWLRTVTVWLKDGSAFKTHALYTGKNVKDHVVLSREPSTHPAWTGQRTLVEKEDGLFDSAARGREKEDQADQVVSEKRAAVDDK